MWIRSWIYLFIKLTVKKWVTYFYLVISNWPRDLLVFIWLQIDPKLAVPRRSQLPQKVSILDAKRFINPIPPTECGFENSSTDISREMSLHGRYLQFDAIGCKRIDATHYMLLFGHWLILSAVKSTCEWKKRSSDVDSDLSSEFIYPYLSHHPNGAVFPQKRRYKCRKSTFWFQISWSPVQKNMYSQVWFQVAIVTRTKKAFVGGISTTTTQEDLQAYFSTFGTVNIFFLFAN